MGKGKGTFEFWATRSVLFHNDLLLSSYSLVAFPLDVSYLRLEAFPYVKNSLETVCLFVPAYSPFNIHNSSTSSSGEASNKDGIHHSLYSAPFRQFGSSSTKTCPRGSRRFYCCTPCTNRIICILYTKTLFNLVRRHDQY